MGFYALFRLFWRRAGILLALAVGFYTWFFVNEEGVPYVWSRPFSLNLYTLLFPVSLAYCVELFTVELQHSPFSWTLPNLRRKLFSSLLFTGITTAFLVTLVYTWFGGPAYWLPIFTSVLLWYSLGMVFSAGNVWDISAEGMYLYGVSVFRISVLSVLVVAGFSINRIAEFYSAQPLLCILIPAVGAPLCLYHFLNVNAARRKSLVRMPSAPPVLMPGAGLDKARSIEKELMARKRTSTRKWQHTGPLAGLSDWIRAGEYENFGADRGGWAAKVFVVSGIAALAVPCAAYLLEVLLLPNANERNLLVVLQIAHVLVSLVPAGGAMAYCLERPLFLRKGWLYPLSRIQLARLTYSGSLLGNTVLYGITLLTLLLSAGFVELYAGYDFVRPMTLILICTPLLQWMRLRYGAYSFRLGILGMAMMLVMVCVFGLWLKVAQDIPAIYEVAACASFILLSQWLYRHKLETYFTKADLI